MDGPLLPDLFSRTQFRVLFPETIIKQLNFITANRILFKITSKASKHPQKCKFACPHQFTIGRNPLFREHLSMHIANLKYKSSQIMSAH